MAGVGPFREVALPILGIGTQYPPHALKPDALNALSEKHYPQSNAMKKVLSINQYTGIEARSSVGTPEHPLVNQEKAPSIKQIHDAFFSLGIPLAISAARKAIKEAKINLSQITHIVSTTCTDSSNPGFDHYVAKKLGIVHQVEKVLLHGVGCSGGLATLRTAANLALGHSARRKPARILCLALEVSTTLVRSELDSINELQETRIGACLFSDCASALVLSNGIGEREDHVYELLAWDHRIIPDTEDDLGFDVDPLGWKVVLTPRVPRLAGASIQPAFESLLTQLPELPPNYQKAADFDWAMHPGGATILSGAERVLDIKPEHMRASYDRYINHGNSSSATIFSVIDRLRHRDMDSLTPDGHVRDYVVGCAFGPGISVEMCILKRNKEHGTKVLGMSTPPETDNESSEGTSDDDLSPETFPEVQLPEADKRFIENSLEQLALD